MLCLINARTPPHDWDSVLEFFYAKTMHTIVHVIDAPVNDVKHALFKAVMERQDVHHYHGDNGLYAVWDTLDGRTAVMVVSNPSETLLPLQIAGHALGTFKEWEHKLSSLWGVGFENIGSNVPTAFCDLFDNILSAQTHTVLTNAILLSHTVSHVKKI